MASELAPEDFISNMPDNVITNILHRLPLLDAVRTAILSRNWRFKWTKLSELLFDDIFFSYLLETKDENTFGMIVSRILLHISGAVTKSVLILSVLDVESIHHLILFLSKNGIKDLTLTSWTMPQLKLPTHLFSCLELKRLNVCGCRFNPPPDFRGFPNLLSLELRAVQFGDCDLGEFLTRCPLLEDLNLGYLSYTGSVKLVEIAKLKNLKILFLSVSHLETATTCNVFELVVHLPKLQELGLDFQDCRLTEGGVKKKLLTASPSLKALKFTSLDFGNGIVLSFALEVIRLFPNLQTLEMTAILQVPDPFPITIPIPVLEAEYNMAELRSVVFNYFKGSENEVYMIKYFLACSPSLKKIDIQRNWCLPPGEQLIFAKKLLKLHRASPVAEISFK
ncbi:F-box/FBD/LRR-repeat protein At1g13570-like [Bidens hawaiensis]|uniref:F-box/FBD/LRR-repeat protein At1g13570-like n=1 Tax=Bidens hawaiensis TaxID=980011 RepID=UPI004048FFEB